MGPDEYRNSVIRSVRRVLQGMRGLLGMLPGEPSDTQWRTFVRTAYPMVMQARLETFDTSRDYYLSQRPSDDNPPEFVERSYPVEALDKALQPTRIGLSGAEDAQADIEALEAQMLDTVERHSLAAGRDAVTDTAKRDDLALGWARVASGAETCAFCTMLVSRGPVYTSKQSAGFQVNQPGREHEPYHDRCDCVPTPVFDDLDWPGRDAYLDAQKLWANVTRGHYGDAALVALRAHLTAEQSGT